MTEEDRQFYQDNGLDPDEIERATREAEEQLARAEEVPCRYRNCIEWHDPQTGENLGGFGPVGCPCQEEA